MNLKILIDKKPKKQANKTAATTRTIAKKQKIETGEISTMMLNGHLINEKCRSVKILDFLKQFGKL